MTTMNPLSTTANGTAGPDPRTPRNMRMPTTTEPAPPRDENRPLRLVGGAPLPCHRRQRPGVECGIDDVNGRTHDDRGDGQLTPGLGPSAHRGGEHHQSENPQEGAEQESE